MSPSCYPLNSVAFSHVVLRQMEVYSRRRWILESAQLSNKFGYCPLYTLSIVFKFINTTAYHLGRYEPSQPISYRAPQEKIHQSPPWSTSCLSHSCYSVTRWLDYLFNIWSFTTIFVSPKALKNYQIMMKNLPDNI